MSIFGTYRLTYTPPEQRGFVESTVDMSISSEASLDEMLRTFESFLQATGYVLGDRELVLETPEKESVSDQSYWDEDGFSLVGNPWTATYGEDTVYIGSGLFGGAGEDHLSFRSNFGNDVVTFG
jgi:hypothetical protein